MEDPKKPANNPLTSILGGLLGKNTEVAVKPKSDGIHITIDGIDQKIALKHIRNLINDILGE